MRDELKNSTHDRLTDALFYLFAVTTIIRSTPTSAGGVATNPAAAAGATGAAAVGTLRTANAATQLAAASGTVKAKKALPEIEMHFEPDRDSMVLPPASTVPVEFEATANDELPSAIDVHSDVKPIPEPANGMLFKEFNSEVLLHDICFFTLVVWARWLGFLFRYQNACSVLRFTQFLTTPIFVSPLACARRSRSFERRFLFRCAFRVSSIVLLFSTPLLVCFVCR